MNNLNGRILNGGRCERLHHGERMLGWMLLSISLDKEKM